jgi:N-acetylmuramoyl-L-alanine amidase
MPARTFTRILAAGTGFALAVAAGQASFSGTVTTASPVYTVQAGDSLWKIASIDGLTVNQVAGANGLSPDAGLQPGMVLDIPPASYTPDTDASDTDASDTDTADTDESDSAAGDSADSAADTMTSPTTAAIATDTSSDDAAAATASDSSDTADSSASSDTSSSDTSSAAAASSDTADFCSTFVSSGGPEGVLPPLLAESPDRLALQPLFVQYAYQYGLSPALVEAIAWQESGWQEGVVSDAQAVGVGQLIPSTADFINQDLIGEDLDDTQAADNIQMSAAFLGYLSRVEDGNLCDIIAAYYEGPVNLAADGVFAITEPYVESVEALIPRFE